jgi:hypothetical protein
LARLSPDDRNLTALLAVWDRLTDDGHKLLRQTAITLAGTLPSNRRREA